jgi:hypothetical protein
MWGASVITSEGIEAITAAMVKAQHALKPAVKDATNPAYKSKYADLAAVWHACRDSLTTNGIAVWQDVQVDDAGVSVITRLAHTSGQWVQFGPLKIPLGKKDAHGVGSATSYGKRYALAAAVGVVAEDDDDGNEASKNSNGAAAAKQPAFDRKHTPMAETGDEFAKLTLDQQQWYRDEAAAIMTCFQSKGDLHAHIEDRRYSTEDRLFLWLLLPSDCRSAIKQAQQAARVREKETA